MGGLPLKTINRKCIVDHGFYKKCSNATLIQDLGCKVRLILHQTIRDVILVLRLRAGTNSLLCIMRREPVRLIEFDVAVYCGEGRY